jgi:transcriptional regulator PpsR
MSPVKSAKSLPKPAAAKSKTRSTTPTAPRLTRLTRLFDTPSAVLADAVASGNDISVVLDSAGTVLQVHTPDATLAAHWCSAWQGQRLHDVVTTESRDKVAALLQEALSSGRSARWRQVNHPNPQAKQGVAVNASGDDLPVLYSATALAVDGVNSRAAAAAFLLSGRDLRSNVQLQHRLVEAQQLMERDYWRFREAETRYRTLFQSAAEAVLIAEGPNYQVQEANPAAENLFGRSAARLAGTPLLSLLDRSAAELLLGQMAAVRTGKTAPAARVRLGAQATTEGGAEHQITVALFRQDQASYWLIRLAPIAAAATKTRATAPKAATDADALLQAYATSAAEGLVFTDAHGRIVSANPAFAALAQLSAPAQAQGQSLDRWLGNNSIELAVLMKQLRERGAVGLYSTRLRGEFGAVLAVEISATRVGSHLAFSVRDVGRRLVGNNSAGDNAGGAAAPETTKLAPNASELSELVGRVPMKDIVSETSDMIEKLCIETALSMTQDNRAVAAQLLGLSRQSLYVKLRRYGLGDLGADAEVEANDNAA